MKMHNHLEPDAIVNMVVLRSEAKFAPRYGLVPPFCDQYTGMRDQMYGCAIYNNSIP